MGDPLSPGMTIGACGWMEDEWMQTLSVETKSCFRAKRFMDDILLVHTRAAWWDHERFLRDFNESTCYHEPLKLEDGKEGVFLETSFRFDKEAGRFRYCLKNDNRLGEEPKVWRYQHFKSHAPFLQKRAVLLGCLRKVHAMASDAQMLRSSAQQKLAEFQRLQYPPGMLKGACRQLATVTGTRAWFDVRDAI